MKRLVFGAAFAFAVWAGPPSTVTADPLTVAKTAPGDSTIGSPLSVRELGENRGAAGATADPDGDPAASNMAVILWDEYTPKHGTKNVSKNSGGQNGITSSITGSGR